MSNIINKQTNQKIKFNRSSFFLQQNYNKKYNKSCNQKMMSMHKKAQNDLKQFLILFAKKFIILLLNDSALILLCYKLVNQKMLRNIINKNIIFSFKNKNFYQFGVIKDKIEKTLVEKMKPDILKVLDESSGHSRGKQTHFNVLIVSQQFNNLNRMQRHKLVYSNIGELIKEFHALTLTCKSLDQISKDQSKKQQFNESPSCMHKKA